MRELLVGRDFIGLHPWEAERIGADGWLGEMRTRLEAEPNLGVGEIGLDRLRAREISPRMREVFETQLNLAAEFRRPVVLHGAKCWGQVVATIRRLLSAGVGSVPAKVGSVPAGVGSVPAFLFHGFSRSEGLIPEIMALNGFISVGPAVLNAHAVNYRELVKKIPLDRLLIETDRTEPGGPSVREVLVQVAAIRGQSVEELEEITDRTAQRFKEDNR